MNIYLKRIIHQLKNYNSTLHKTSILIDKPWALIDEDQEIQKLIFKSNKELILSKNGQVQIGKWEYFPEAKSILIDRGTDKILCNEAFINQGVMILHLDGTENKFFIFANENIIPNLDAIGYLKELRHQKLNISETELMDGRVFEVHDVQNDSTFYLGCTVTENANPIRDGIYQLADPKKYLEIKNGKIFKELTETKFINPSGLEITIQHRHFWSITYGDYLFLSGKQVDNAVIDFSELKKIIVKDGIIIRFEYKNKILNFFYQLWEKILKNV